MGYQRKLKEETMRGIDLTGNVFGRLTVIQRGENQGDKVTWLCQCSCGSQVSVITSSLRRGDTKSCGCLFKESLIKRNTTHGNMKRGNGTKTYNTWRGMIARCEDPLNKRYDNYHGKGIEVCEEWHDFSVFLGDMGERPKGLTLDRIDNTKGYYKDNCRWATLSEQANNRSNNNLQTSNGKTMTIMQWSKYLGVHRNTLSNRMKQGWDFDAVVKYYESKKVIA